MGDFDRNSMIEMFVFEINQLIENLEQTIIESEDGFSDNAINEIFRIMHTIKGSSAMMLYDDISSVSHAVEDMFFYLRENNINSDAFASDIVDIVFEAMDFVKAELEKVENGEEIVKHDNLEIYQKIESFLDNLKTNIESKNSEEIEDVVNPENETTNEDRNYNNELINAPEKDISIHIIKYFFNNDSEMKNVRAFTIYNNFESMAESMTCQPSDLFGDDSEAIIEDNGFELTLYSNDPVSIIMNEVIKTSNVDTVSLEKIQAGEYKFEDLHFLKLNIEFSEETASDNSKITNFLNRLDTEAEIFKILDLDLNSKITTMKFDLHSSQTKEELTKYLNGYSELKSFEIISKEESSEVIEIESEEVIEEVTSKEIIIEKQEEKKEILVEKSKANETKKQSGQQVINVNVGKLDQLLNLVGELVTTEAMVTQNPELDGLELENFYKDARQLHKIIGDVQDIVMSMRMVPLSTVFLKMHRIVRDMSKKLKKPVRLEIIGEETEVDKNIIEHIQDPLMHIIRNAIDHGIEDDPAIRLANGKNETGTIVLEAKNSGGDVLIYVHDDGAGIDIEKVYAKAVQNNLIDFDTKHKYTDKEIQQFIFRAGFSTNDTVTTYSGRGVGMDVVVNNIQMIGGNVEVDSEFGKGSSFVLKIPLTLAIIDGMLIKIGDAKYTLPIVSIRQSFKATKDNIHTDPNGNEMIKVRGELYNLIRLPEFFGIESSVDKIEDGIMLLVEEGSQALCLFADELIGEYPVVVKSMPKYIKEIRAISGCTLLGDGDISLIIDIAGFFNK